MTSKPVLLIGASLLSLAGLLVLLPASAGNPVPLSPCVAKCDMDYEAEAAQCGKIEDDTERRKCQDDAHGTYTTCREGCAKPDNPPRGADSR